MYLNKWKFQSGDDENDVGHDHTHELRYLPQDMNKFAFVWCE